MSEEEAMGFGGKVVLALLRTVDDKPTTRVYFDNFFTSLEILCHEYGILGLGTLNKNRTRGCTFIKITKSTVRSTTYEKFDQKSGITVVSWIDNKQVLLASNYIGKEPMSTVSRYSKSDSNFKDSFDSRASLEELWCKKAQSYPNIRNVALRYLMVFSTTYLSEQGFSTLLQIKNKQRNKLTSVSADLTLALSKLQPTIPLLVGKMRAQISH